MRHAGKLGGDDSSVDVFAQRQGEFRLVAYEFRRFNVFAQPDNFALAVRNLNSDGALARHALDQNALSFEREAEIIGQIG